MILDLSTSPTSIRIEPPNAWRAESKSSAMKFRFEKRLSQNVVLGSALEPRDVLSAGSEICIWT